MPDHPSLDTLLARLVEETITSEELEVLECRLDEDPAAQDRYLRYLDLHGHLGGIGDPTLETTVATSRVTVGTVVSIALASLALAALFSLFKGANLPGPTITVADLDGPVRWIAGDAPGDVTLAAGDQLGQGTLETLAANSWIEVAFPDGTGLQLAGQSVLTIAQIDGQKILRLRSGNLSVDAAEQPPDQPLRILTPSAEAEVLGTQFNVKTDALASQFVVNEGRVRVRRLADGKVQDVAANQQVIAALEQDTEFRAGPRRQFVETWKSVLRRDQLQGRWEPAGEDGTPAGLRAMPILWKGDRGERETPLLLYTAVFDPSPGILPPVRLSERSHFRIRGRIATEHEVNIGFGSNHPRGGFAGKYAFNRTIKPDSSGRFEFDLPLDLLRPMKGCFPESPIGQEISWFWIVTVQVDAGLVVEHVEVGQ